nr:STAS domain-containing protein [Streptomyces sp. NA04227]
MAPPPMSSVTGAGLPDVDERAVEARASTADALVLRGEIGRGELARLCGEVEARLGDMRAGPGGTARARDGTDEAVAPGAPPVIVCDVVHLDASGFGAVEVLARLQLTARRAGGRIGLRGPAPGLRTLLGLAGLLGTPGFTFEPLGDPEEREPPGGVQEGVEPGDPAL